MLFRSCRKPVLYGGGLIDVMEVNCPGRQGERLQIVLESQLTDAQRFVLQSFSAKARVD